MSDTIIKVENLSKRYRIGARELGYKTFREAIIDGFKAPIRNLHRLRKLTKFDDNPGKEQKAMRNEPTLTHPASYPVPSSPDDTIWALRDVSFEVKQGEVLGIIGRNGAGKSTLLKILSRITEPTSGDVKIYGRVSSLLEVGTGFHQELTGRENIYLNGAILGMRKKEIDGKFDQIVDFAEIEKFIDTPVKRYSTGMSVRLAFAVAAHLEPEILLVDEVLAVGDIYFQRKCLGKMSDVSKTGRTILFVSHNMGAVESLCSRAYWIDKGCLREQGPTRETIKAYIETSTIGLATEDISRLNRLQGGREIQLSGLKMLNNEFSENRVFNYGETLIMHFYFEILNKNRRYFAIEWTICNEAGVKIIYGSSSPQQSLLIAPNAHFGCVECRIPHLPLTVGTYHVDCSLSVPHRERLDVVEEAATFQVAICDPYSSGFNLSSQVAPTTVDNKWTIVNGAEPLID